MPDPRRRVTPDAASAANRNANAKWMVRPSAGMRCRGVGELLGLSCTYADVCRRNSHGRGLLLDSDRWRGHPASGQPRRALGQSLEHAVEAGAGPHAHVRWAVRARHRGGGAVAPRQHRRCGAAGAAAASPPAQGGFRRGRPGGGGRPVLQKPAHTPSLPPADTSRTNLAFGFPNPGLFVESIRATPPTFRERMGSPTLQRWRLSIPKVRASS